MKVKVTLFKPNGRYYTEEEWEVPPNAIGPADMQRSPNFRRIDGGAVLIEWEQWGYPHLFPGDPYWPDVPIEMKCPFCGGYVRGHQWIGQRDCSIISTVEVRVI